jgi:isopenicillin-N epimerase
MPTRQFEIDADWQAWASAWKLRPDTIYLNHGSFGPPPEPVRQARLAWQEQLDRQPMDFFVRTLEPALREARERLARFVGTRGENLVFVENATYGMNVVAGSFALGPGDEVLLTDHEYGAVKRIWERACRRAETAPPRVAKLPLPFTTSEAATEALFAAATERTKLLIVSHITSPTAVILPIRQICGEARRRGIAVCIDGPHAPAQVDVHIDEIGCDYYAASCHKWLSAPFGSGFLYVHPSRQAQIETPLLSWGRLLPNLPQAWDDEFIWSGTRDPSPYLSIPAAIDFLESVGLDNFRRRTHALARYARALLVELVCQVGPASRAGLSPARQAGPTLEPLVPDSDEWYGSMAHVPLPPGDAKPLQEALWRKHGIEVPIVDWNGGRYVRVSCHLYNTREEIDRLVAALHMELQGA